MNSETIAAIATPMSNSGIGIVRMSGDDAFEIAKKVFRKKNGGALDTETPNTIHYGYIYDGDEEIDEVLVMIMKGPHSYTAEDTVEIDGHGGVLVMQKILETVIRYGARPAEPGEFTKRAFLNGRIDLSQAEAVIDVINSRNDYALKSSIGQLGGDVSEKIRDIRKKILDELAYLEAALDDPEHISLDGYKEELTGVITPLMDEISTLIDSADNGRIMTEGIRTVILGKPNAGKSTLMNVLVGEDRAIVTEVAGTTRDTLEENIRLQDISLNIVDTAGIRRTEDVVEQIGVARAKNAAADADLIIYVVDSSIELDQNDQDIIEMLKDKKAIVLLNKSDLEQVVSAEELEALTGCRVISISAKERTGIDELEDTIKSMFYKGTIDFNDQVYITNIRHKKALCDALKSLKLVKKSIDDNMPEDLYSIDLMDAYRFLGTIIGEEVGEDLINEIFSKFCMGK